MIHFFLKASNIFKSGAIISEVFKSPGLKLKVILLGNISITSADYTRHRLIVHMLPYWQWAIIEATNVFQRID